MILITDIINSPVGHALLQLLLSQKEHEPVRVMVTPYDRLSHEDGFEPVVSSFYDLPSLDRALKGVDTLLISTFNLFTDCRCGYLNLLHEAVAEGVKRIIFISSVGRSNSVSLPMQENRETEMHIQQSGIPYAVFLSSGRIWLGEEARYRNMAYDSRRFGFGGNWIYGFVIYCQSFFPAR